MHLAHMILDFQFGSTGKGLLAGYLAKREGYDTAVCAFAANAGHTYMDMSRQLHVMTQQLPTAITSPTVKTILLGPGSLICPETLRTELYKYREHIAGKQILIHPQAAVILPWHTSEEKDTGLLKIGSTGKGVGAAMIERIRRNPESHNTVARVFPLIGLGHLVATTAQYREALEKAEAIIIEGAQGFGLSLYHGFYPYTTSRDVTPWQIAADCGLPFKWATYINVFGTLRSFPIRVNNRDGSSGPGHPDQEEISWDQIGVPVELTTVTKLPRRLFTFSHQQTLEAFWHCGQYWKTSLFLNFANYLKDADEIDALIAAIEQPREMAWNPPKVEWVGFGADDSEVVTRKAWDESGPEVARWAEAAHHVAAATDAAEADSEGGEPV